MLKYFEHTEALFYFYYTRPVQNIFLEKKTHTEYGLENEEKTNRNSFFFLGEKGCDSTMN